MQVRGRGELLSYCSQQPQKSTVNGKPTEFSYTQPGYLTISIPYDTCEVVVTL